MGKRLAAFDVIRGFSVVSMVLFHLCYDVKFIAHKPLPWFAPPFQDVWRASISWTFLFVAGCMCSFSRNNLRRSLRYGVVALLIFVVTTIAGIDVPISFGIIFCMAACTFVAWILERLHHIPKSPVYTGILLFCFLLTLHVSRHHIGIGNAGLELPSNWYRTPWLSWLGLPGPGFTSGDYYPVIPYVFIYLAGSSMGWWWQDVGFPSWLRSISCTPLEFIGKHALPVYLAHQPILLGICLVL